MNIKNMEDYVAVHFGIQIPKKDVDVIEVMLSNYLQNIFAEYKSGGIDKVKLMKIYED